MRKLLRGTALLVLPICFSLSAIGTGLAQNTNSGDIRGTVTDPSGAVMPGVTVTVEDVDKGVTRTYTTNGDGLYDTGSIVPDNYILTFSKPGFETVVRGPLTLEVGITGVSTKLAVGSTSQKVIVKANTTLLNTETGSQATTLSASSMAQLPQVGADWQNFVITLPGVAGSPTQPLGGINSGQSDSVNGNLPYSTVLANGATTTLPMSQNSDVTVFETTAEVKIDTSAFSAQYGVGGVTYNQITKGGGEQFHGVAYEYFQNNALNAAPYAFGANASVPVLHYNNFGGSISGPIIKNRMFFYFNYDKTIDIGGAANGFETVPTAAMLSGDFTGFPTIYDPTTQVIAQTPSGPVVTRTSFADEYHNGNKIPSNLIDPVAAAIATYFPKPNTAGTVVNGLTTNNFFYNTPSSNPFVKYTGRLDWDITPTNRLTASEVSSDNPATYLNQGICPVNCQSGDVSRDNAQVSDVWSISPNTINEARMGFTDQLNFFAPYSLNEGFPAKLGLLFSKADTFPTVNINQIYTLGPQSNAVYKEFVFDPSDVVTLIRGKHVLHFGAEILINRADSTAWGNLNAATVTYDPVYTSATGVSVLTNPPPGIPAVSGIGFADFLLGQTEKWGAGVTPEYGGRLKLPQAFVQDDIKVRPNLTVNLGLRWQGITGWSEVKGNLAAFDPTVLNPATNTPGAMWYGITHANGRTRLQAPVWNTFMPRIGVSWQPTPTIVVRGGVGLYAYTWSEDTYGYGLGGAFGSSGNTSDTTNGLCPVVQLSADGNSPDTTNPGCGVPGFNGQSINSLYLTAPTAPDSRNGQSVSYNEYHTPVPKIWQYNVEIQREIGTNMVANLAYVGSYGYNLAFPADINQVHADNLGPNDNPSGRPYPQFQALSGSTNNAGSNYNSLQATLQRRFVSGLQFNFNYTWSHFLNDQDSSGWGQRGGTQPWQIGYSPSANYGPSGFDIHSMFKGEVVYQLPVGKGRRFVNNNYVLDQLIGGWQAAATIIAQTGNPFTVTMNSDNSYSQGGDGAAAGNSVGNYAQYPNVIGNPHSGPRSNSEWFNIAAFTQPAPGTFGDSSRNSLYGPSLTDVNFSLGKNFPIWRQVVLQIRGDATNVFNHPSFGLPNAVIGSGQEGQIKTVTVGGRTMQLYGRISF
ncbi:MAG TPA: carboxypeptidase-like regulatory domain-containing protein [Acidobacteriaceae bacterium]